LILIIISLLNNPYSQEHLEYYRMSLYNPVGSQVQLIFQTRFPTFTADQFTRALKDKAYVVTQGQVNLPQNAGAITTNIFSKGNMNVFIFPPANQIFFQLLNTINPHDAIDDEIKPILVSLNIVEDAISSIILTCTTAVSATSEEPQKALTGIIKEDFLKRIDTIVNKNMGAVSIRLATSFPLEKEGGLQVVIEPLGTNPKKSYYVNLAYITANMREFNEFISIFNDKMILDIIESVNGHD
jgi:hypothetical protein